jgi:hypothetical protein
LSINFTEESWNQIKETYELWWSGKLKRPIVPVILTGNNYNGIKPNVPLLTQNTCHRIDFSAKEVVDAIDYELSSYKFLGDAFPYFNMDAYGPGVLAAFLGAVLDNSTGKVWFHEPKEIPIQEIHLEYNPNNVWLKRIKDIYTCGMEKWKGNVIFGMPDLGGTLDALAVLRAPEALLMDLYDYPEEVNRLVWEIHHLWHKIYNEFSETLQSNVNGFTDWSSIYSDKPSYIIQSDFSYMLSPQMFKEFVLDEVTASCKLLDRTIYHLDGQGQLNHLDFLLNIENLNGIQWIPGEGSPDQTQWPDVYKKIHAAGKKIQLTNGFEALDTVINQISDMGSIHHITMYEDISREREIRGKLQMFGIN